MAQWRAYAFVILITLMHPIFLLGLHLSGRDLRKLSLAYLSISTIIYIWVLKTITIPFFFSPLRHLPEPPGAHFLWGHSNKVFLERPQGKQAAKWMQQVPNDGLIFFRGVAQTHPHVILTTPEALTEVLNNKAYDWVKPGPARRFLHRVLGDGLVVVEGPEHKRQRKSVAPAFSGKNIRDLVPTFWSKAVHFADAVGDQMKLESTDEKGLRTGTIEINHIAQRITLDIIGKAALGKNMDTVIDPSDELAQQYEVILDPKKGNMALFVAVNILLPQWLLRYLPWKMNQRISQAALNLRHICLRLISEKRAALAEKNTDASDILSALIRTNQFTDDEIKDQLLTFLAAGHETTSSALTWACYLLSLHPSVQSTLRHEIHSHLKPSTQVTADTIESMPYLHAVCSEVLRIYPTVPVTARVSTRRTTIGSHVIPKNTAAIICQWGINRLPSLWGPDAGVFNPERWVKDPVTGGASSRHAFLTFLHGPRSCIGQSFAFNELKCLLAALVGRFEVGLQFESDREGAEPSGAVTIKPAKGLHLKLREVSR